MRRLLLALIAGLAVFAVAAAAASFQVTPSVLQGVTFVVDLDLPDPPDDLDEIPWQGHGSEHEDRTCEGLVTWRFVLTQQPRDAEATLVIAFAEAGERRLAGERRGEGQVGPIRFEVVTPAGDAIASAAALVEGGDGRGTLTLSETSCEVNTGDPDGADPSDADGAASEFEAPGAHDAADDDADTGGSSGDDGAGADL